MPAFSVAGKRRGTEDDRYLWPEMVRVIKELRPHWVVGENVAGIVKMALNDILSELETEGYRTRTFLIPACAVGARHRRYRTAIVGCAEHNGLSSTALSGSTKEAGGREQERQAEAGKPAGTGQSTECTDVADSKSNRLQRERSCGKQGRRARYEKGEPERRGYVRHSTGKGLPDRAGRKMERPGASEPELKRPDSYVSNSDIRKAERGNRGTPEIEKTRGRWSDNGSGEKEHEPGEWRPAQSGLGGMADGIPSGMDGYWDIEPDIPRITDNVSHRCDRIKSLGNAVVPQQFYPVFKAIADIEKEIKR